MVKDCIRIDKLFLITYCKTGETRVYCMCIRCTFNNPMQYISTKIASKRAKSKAGQWISKNERGEMPEHKGTASKAGGYITSRNGSRNHKRPIVAILHPDNKKANLRGFAGGGR